MEQLYAHPLSEPSRTIAWLCQLNNHAIGYNMVKLLEGGTRTPEFRETVSAIGKIPVLKDGDFSLTESHAIMIYLAEKHGWYEWYPKDLKTRARIHEYMNGHHLNVRPSSEMIMNHVNVVRGKATPEIEAHIADESKAINSMLRILVFWLRDGNEYLATQSHATIADLSCLNEVMQLEAVGLLGDVDAKFPKVSAWLKRMKEIPHHDEQLAAIMAVFTKYKMIPSPNI